MKIPFGRPIIEEEEKNAVLEVLNNPILVHGPKAVEFENNFATHTGAKNAISVSSCTAGMHLIYFALGLGEGDEVIVPAQSHVATAHAVELVGAKAVFVDVYEDTGNINNELIENLINNNTKAIAVVHYLGVPVDMEPIMEIAKKYNLFVLEDCALAPGTKLSNTHAGLIGDAGVFSFYPIKHFTTAEGGMIILNNQKLADKLRLKKAFGINRNHTERATPGLYEAVELGFNYRMSELHAALGVEQLKKLPRFLNQRKVNFEFLEARLNEIPKIRVMCQPVNEHKTSSHYCLGLILEKDLSSKRALIMDSLKAKGVGTSIYYPNPIPRMPYYKSKYGYDKNYFKNAATISDCIIALPVGPHLSLEDMNYIVESLNSTFSELNV